MQNLLQTQRQVLRKALKNLNLKNVENILVFADLGKIGFFLDNFDSNEICKEFYKAILDVFGADITIMVPTYTTQVGRYGEVFELENTKCVTGLFPEYIRNLPNSVRSLHPLHSFSSIGRNSELFCKDNSLNNFGYNSPLNNFHREGGHIMSIGLPAGYCLAIAHYVEAMFSVPYVYNKLLDCKVMKNGGQIYADFTATVRHLELEYSLEFSAWIKSLNSRESISGVELGRHSIFAVTFQEAFNSAQANLVKNPYFLINQKPDFVPGVVPYDGTTVARENDKANQRNPNIGRKSEPLRLNLASLDHEIIQNTIKRGTKLNDV